jgi:polyferredoxin
MTKVDRPIGLIAFDTAINQQARRHGGEPARWRLVRPRTIVYASVLAAVAGVLLVGLVLRETLDVNVLADRSPLFVRLSDGGVRNAYTVKLLNKTPDPRAFNITVTGATSARMAIAGVTEGELPAEFGAIVTVKPDSVGAFRVLLHVPADQVRPEIPLTVSVTEMRTGEHVTRSEIFHGPN